ncbi:MAG: glutamate racemase [Anaerolineae bacterium]|nr:glutamate racemase [Anaerolineae bacterium]
MTSRHQPIGLFDSGIGGLSVLQHVRQQLPDEDLLYFADQAHVPYGRRSAESVQQLSLAVTRFLLEQGAKLIVVACNTASAAALTWLRQTVPSIPFVGMEPAVKPGAQSTQTGSVGVLATQGTFGSPRYARLMASYANGVTVYENPCLGLVELIEAGESDSAETEALLKTILLPMLAKGVDTLVLGCTHYPFAIDAMRRVVGPDITIIDPAPAVVRQTRRVLTEQELLNDSGGSVVAYTSGDVARFVDQTSSLLDSTFPTFHHAIYAYR